MTRYLTKSKLLKVNFSCPSCDNEGFVEWPLLERQDFILQCDGCREIMVAKTRVLTEIVSYHKIGEELKDE
jgi:hypothetical protein